MVILHLTHLVHLSSSARPPNESCATDILHPHTHMDSHTITLVLAAVVVLVIVNFLFVDDAASSSSSHRFSGNSRTVVVTNEMIEAVRAVGPGLSTQQIKADLRLTGNVQATVERYLAGVIVSNQDIASSSVPDSGKERISTTDNITGDDEYGPFNGMTFEEKKRQLIKENRAKYEKKHGVVL